MTSQSLTQPTALIQTFTGEINGISQNLVNARDLHAFLEVGRDFSNWIKARIFDYDFQENQDFIVYANLGENPNGGRPTIEYHLTLDMAKELSMVERNEQGRLARRYFIECERHLYSQNNPLNQIADHMATLATGMQTLAQASTATMAKLDHTERYINLLELNQKGHIKVTPEVIDQVKLMKEQGYSQASIGRLLRISSTTVSQIIHDKYPMNKVTSDENITRLVETAKSVLEQGE